MEIYESGPTLRYDEGHMSDEYGQLGDQPLPLSEFGPYEISAAEFELAWQGEGGAPNTTLSPSS